MSDRQIAFVSGPIDTGPSESYFHTHYVTKINEAIERDHDFVLGPIPSGVDADALAYLLLTVPVLDRITIFVTQAEDGMWGERFRTMGVHVEVVEGQMTRDRDAALTRASTYDILRVRTKAEAQALYGSMWREGHITNTERNWKRRRGIAENEVVAEQEINRSMGYSSDPAVPTKPIGRIARWMNDVFQFRT
ncbi:uncharacterized protein N7511_000027 [Penicillium nucicola]|uniref:uncharacterized protein n=1 Tax=Penicillium nucicola TaxID=1850975 RepID=UPI0025451388|nr:uncharacterized protein N7511_000027 [Penicillium nucicola]KAJ5775016.1 hypothetical protein N7511_000027 [Penicillium nucicola]